MIFSGPGNLRYLQLSSEPFTAMIRTLLNMFKVRYDEPDPDAPAEEVKELEKKQAYLEDHTRMMDVLKKATSNPAWKAATDKAITHFLPKPQQKNKRRRSEEEYKVDQRQRLK